MMNKTRFKTVFDGLNSAAQKVYLTIPEDAYWGQTRIINELVKNGIRLSTDNIAGCLHHLVETGLLIAGSGGTYARERIKEDAPKLALAAPKTVEPALLVAATACAPTTATDKLLAISIRLNDLANAVKAVSSDVDSVIEDVERTITEGSAEAEKLQQLRSLLKSIA